MTDKKMIAGALLEIAQNSTTEFLEVSADNKELINAAKKLGIVLPSPDLAVFKTVYAEIDKVNRNDVILPKKAVKEGLQTLLGKQINWEHDGAGRICGYIIDASIKGNIVEIIGVLFKSLFPEEMQIVKSRFKKKELAVSFEIWNVTEEGSSTVTELSNGTMIIDPIMFHGCGLLLSADPACPKAKVYTLMAQKEINDAEKIADKVFSKDLIFASLAIKESNKEEEKIMDKEVKIEEAGYKCQCIKCGNKMEASEGIHCKDLKCSKCGGDMRREDRPGKGQPQTSNSDKEEEIVDKEVKLEKTKVSEVKPEETKKVVKPEETKKVVKPEEAKKETKVVETKVIPEVKAEEKKAEVKKEAKIEKPKDEKIEPKAPDAKPEEAKKVVKPEEAKKETKSEETKKEAEVKAEEVTERKVVKTVTESTTTVTETPKEDGYTTENKGRMKRTTFYSDNTESVSQEDYEVVDKYTRAELDKAVDESIDELVAAFPKEVSDCVKKKVKDGKKPADAVKECWKAYKDSEIATLKTKLEQKPQDLNKAKADEKPEGTKPKLEVGTVTEVTEDPYRKDRDAIDRKAFKR